MRTTISILVHILAWLIVGWVLGAPGVMAQAPQHVEDQPVTVKINDDFVQPAGATHGVVVVVRGNAQVSGEVQTLVVVEGTAELLDATVASLTVVRGDAMLNGTTEITGDVQLLDATLAQEDMAVVRGTVKEGIDNKWGPGAAIFGALFGVGFMLAVLLAGVMLATLAPHAVRRVGMAIIDEPLHTVLAGLAVWVLFPIMAVIAGVTVVGLPLALGFMFFVLPTLIFIGYLIAGMRIGDLVMEKRWGIVEYERPIQASILGLTILLLLGWVPLIGGIVTPLAAFLGMGALALAIWRVIVHKEPWRKQQEVGA